MRFTVTDSHVQREARQQLWIGLFFACLLAGCVVAVVKAEKLSAMVVPALGGYFLANAAWSAFRQRREGAESYPVVDLDEVAGTLLLSHQGMSVSLPLDQIQAVRLQYRRGVLVSILAQTPSLGAMRLAGYAQLDVLADALKSRVPAQQVSTARFYHR